MFWHSPASASSVDPVGHDRGAIRTQSWDKGDRFIGSLAPVCATEISLGQGCNNLRSFRSGRDSMGWGESFDHLLLVGANPPTGPMRGTTDGRIAFKCQ